MAFAEALAARAAAAIENARLFREGVRFKRLLDATSDAVLLADLPGNRITYANRGAVEQFGRPVEELLGTSIECHLDPEEARSLKPRSTPSTRARPMPGRRPFTSCARTRSRSRSRSASSSFTSPRQPPRILAIARDIRERIARSRRPPALADRRACPGRRAQRRHPGDGRGRLRVRRDGTIILANPAGEDVFPDVDEQTYAEILAQLNDPGRRRRPLGARGGPVELRARRDDRALDRARDLSGQRRGRQPAERRARRSSSCAT